MSSPSITYVLGIDQAEVSGWSLHPLALDGVSMLRPVAHGVARTHADRVSAIETAARASGEARSLLVCFEDHSGMPLTRGSRYDKRTGTRPTRSTATILGMGEARGRWEAALDYALHPTTQRMDVEPRTWRKRVLGSYVGDTDALKEQARVWACMLAGEHITDHNEAEGICIAAWCSLDGIRKWQHDRELRAAKRRKTA